MDEVQAATELDLPAMVIWGRTDPYVPLEFGERLAERMKAELVVLECGHWWPYEKRSRRPKRCCGTGPPPRANLARDQGLGEGRVALYPRWDFCL